jgi:cytochrome c-type biogenesis protein CcmH
MSENISSIKQQLSQLRDRHAAGELDDGLYQTEKAVLERRLVDLVVTTQESEGHPRLIFAGIALVVVAVASAGYWWTTGGRKQALQTTTLPAVAAPALAASAPHGTENDQVASMVDRLAARLKDKPQDAEGWAMLARSYSVLGRHAEALTAYEKAIALRKDDANLLADYADSLAVQKNHVLAGEPIKLVERALKLEPHNLKALSMAGTEAFDRQDYKGAVQYWLQLVEFGPADSPLVLQILPGLEQAQQLGGLPPLSKKIGATGEAKPLSVFGGSALVKP